MLILGVIGLLPVVGALVFLVANIFGFGAVLVSKFGRVQPAAAGYEIALTRGYRGPRHCSRHEEDTT
jgi:hypothetical protein